MEALLKVDHVGKKYSRDLKASLRSGARTLLRSYLGETTSSTALAEQEFWAVRDVSFELRRGEVLAILGHNGAGKSTLLKCIAGKLKLDAGSVTLNGTIGHLLEMSAGFEQTLSGRENVRLRGRLMNLRGKALNAYVDEVAEFADLAEFFDSPLQFYSTGMRARLGFAASSAMKPDVLIIDEVLAVGDLSFRLKCYERINEMARHAAVVFVSHSLGQVARMCQRGIYLEKGRVLLDGSVQETIAMYQDKLGQRNEKATRHVLHPELVSLTLLAGGRTIEQGQAVHYGESVAVDVDISRLPARSQLRVMLQHAGSGLIADWNSARNPFPWPEPPSRVRADIGSAELNPGAYSVSLQVMSEDGREPLCISESIAFRVVGDLHYAVPIQRLATWTPLAPA
jgi:lipopolysaccharide transport system ATP-binding protein